MLFITGIVIKLSCACHRIDLSNYTLRRKNMYTLTYQINFWQMLRYAIVMMWNKTMYLYCFHDDAIKWKYFPRSRLDSPYKVQWRGALMFSLICAWINGWANNRDAGDLIHHGTHYDVIVIHTALTNIFHLPNSILKLIITVVHRLSTFAH